ncbi:MAG: methionine adenosyltransferase [Firmicutes bacterium]|nr:methionine adenosyltransferase [Bacillota bacterium]
MFEKVNPSHPDKVADRIAGALVDLAYSEQENPKVAIEVLIGHNECYITGESSYLFAITEVNEIVKRIDPSIQSLTLTVAPQDVHLAKNQEEAIRCGDNGIFKGMPVTSEQATLATIARDIYSNFPTDGKYILDEKHDKLIICQSNANTENLRVMYENAIINPLGDWTGGTGVDAGATNRKLGSDMADSVTGGGLHGKDLSKADVSVNIYAWLKAQQTGEPQAFCCAIGDEEIDGVPYSEIVEIAREYINSCGGFEKFAEWGLI